MNVSSRWVRLADPKTPVRTPAETRIHCVALADRLNAFVEVMPVSASPQGQPLSGLAVAIKDMIDIAGRAPTLGLTTAPEPIRHHDAPVVARLRSAGADLVAVTKMTALAYEPSGSNAEQGCPRNPWSEHHICGGSSSGSAVAVAAGCVDAALGSDTGGSLRIPAHCCGVSSWKPTYGVVPVDGSMPLAPSLDTLGFLAREASVLAAISRVFVAGGDPSPLRRVHVAGDLIPQSDAAVATALAAMQQVIARQGLATGTVALDAVLKGVDVAFFRVLDGEAGRAHDARIQQGSVSGILAARLQKGRSISESDLDAARQSLCDLAGKHVPVMFTEADAILLPVMPDATPIVARCAYGSPQFSARTLYRLSQFTRFVNAFGLPAVALPSGFAGNGLPIGAQLVGPPGSDRQLLALASAIQAASDWHTHVPTLVRDHWSRGS